MTAIIEQHPSRPRRRFIRHWKERYVKGMSLIFIRDVRLDGKRTVKAGDPVTPELRAELGEHRMKMWWQAKRVGCAKMAVVPWAEDKPKTTPKPLGKKG